MHSLQRVRRTSRLERRGLNKTTRMAKVIKFKNNVQSDALKSMENMIMKLSDNWKKYDDKIDKKFNAINKNINEIDSQILEVKSSLKKKSVIKRAFKWIKNKVFRIK